jgi:hypothetical protein
VRPYRLALATVVLGAAVVPLSAAHASCDVDLGGHCTSACGVAASAWTTVRDKAGSKLPDLDCPA